MGGIGDRSWGKVGESRSLLAKTLTVLNSPEAEQFESQANSRLFQTGQFLELLPGERRPGQN